MERLLSALEANETSSSRIRRLEKVPGAFVVENLLGGRDAPLLEEEVRRMHVEFRRSVCGDGLKKRRDSQHHLPIDVGVEAMQRLCERLRPFLPEFAGPSNWRRLEGNGREVSSFLRTYCYEEGDFSAPHFDRAFICDEKKTFSAYSVVIYLNDEFEGGETTFFAEDPRIKPSRRGNTPVFQDRSILKVVARNWPKRGAALVFPHGLMEGSHPNPLHEGSIVRKGSKCIIRTDVMFQNRAEKLNRAVSCASNAGIDELESALKLRADQLCHDVSYLVRMSTRIRKDSDHSAELESNAAAKLYFSKFREQRTRRVRMISDLGLERHFSLEELAQQLVKELASNLKEICFVGLDSRHKILASSRQHLMKQSKRGLRMCRKCGSFFSATNGGLEWHLKNAHGVMEHFEAFNEILASKEAIMIPLESNEVLRDETPVGMDEQHMNECIMDKEFLKEALERGRVKQLSPCLEACRAGDLEILRSCKDSLTGITDSNGSNGLLWAAGFGNLDVCCFFVEELGVNPDTFVQKGRRGYLGRGALHWACRNDQRKIVSYLVEEVGCNVNLRSVDGTTPLCLAVYQGHFDLSKKLILDFGADVLTVNSFGCNLAMWLAQARDEDCVGMCEFLLELDVKFNLINENGQGALHKAAQRGKFGMCKWLLNSGLLDKKHFRPNAFEGSTPSQLARFGGFPELERFLLEHERKFQS